MAAWLPKLLKRVHALAAQPRVRFTLKALRELAELRLGIDAEDACDVIMKLRSTDCVGRLKSEITGEWLYVFKPVVVAAHVYVKLVVRDDCTVVSFHSDEEGSDEETG